MGRDNMCDLEDQAKTPVTSTGHSKVILMTIKSFDEHSLAYALGGANFGMGVFLRDKDNFHGIKGRLTSINLMYVTFLFELIIISYILCFSPDR